MIHFGRLQLMTTYMKGVTGEKLYENDKEWELIERKPVLKSAQAYILYWFTVFIFTKENKELIYEEALTTFSTQVYALYWADILCNLKVFVEENCKLFNSLVN